MPFQALETMMSVRRDASLSLLLSQSARWRDAVRHFDVWPGERVPICCYYNLRAAIQYMSEEDQHAKDEAMSADFDCLLYAYEAYRSK